MLRGFFGKITKEQIAAKAASDPAFHQLHMAQERLMTIFSVLLGAKWLTHFAVKGFSAAALALCALSVVLHIIIEKLALSGKNVRAGLVLLFDALIGAGELGAEAVTLGAEELGWADGVIALSVVGMMVVSLVLMLGRRSKAYSRALENDREQAVACK